MPFTSRESLQSLLKISPPPFLDDILRGAPIYPQLDHIYRHLRDFPTGACQSVLIEDEYIDRDYIEEYSVFYSLSRKNYPNSCLRAHFFSLAEEELESQLSSLLAQCREADERANHYRCAKFSDDAYLGFAVIKPLAGCPIGRTVLRCYPEECGTGERRLFLGTRSYAAHVAGIELQVRGLAFQQQDQGVSACATTAIWSSLQQAQSHEDIASISPARITLAASRFSLPFGRAFPSEGLSVEQMCIAVESTGLSPVVLKRLKFNEARGAIYSALLSGLAPILVIKNDSNPQRYHAVAVMGMRIREDSPGIPVLSEETQDSAGRMQAVYLHDDRHGPYLRADLQEVSKSRLGLRLVIKHPELSDKQELWRLDSLIVPQHKKIRLSLPFLQLLAAFVGQRISELLNTFESLGEEVPQACQVLFTIRILRASTYLSEVSRDARVRDNTALAELSQSQLSRYIAIISLDIDGVGEIDILVDTTSTRRNLHFHAVVLRARKRELASRLMTRSLARMCLAMASIELV